MIKKLLWLDDYRDPFSNPEWLIFSPIGRNIDVFWVKSYDEYVDWIKKNGLPDGICFDHDLADIHYEYNDIDDYELRYMEDYEKTGYDCVKWTCEYCLHRNLPFPKYNIQSGNVVGKENMKTYIENFKKHLL